MTDPIEQKEQTLLTVLDDATCLVDDRGFAWIACMGNQWAIDKDFVPKDAHVEAWSDGPKTVRGRFEVEVRYVPNKKET